MFPPKDVNGHLFTMKRSEGDARERERQLKRHGQAKRWLRERIKRSLEV